MPRHRFDADSVGEGKQYRGESDGQPPIFEYSPPRRLQETSINGFLEYWRAQYRSGHQNLSGRTPRFVHDLFERCVCDRVRRSACQQSVHNHC